MTILILLLILSILVLVHEFGHFFVAKKVDVRVEEFGWGLPPRAWGKKIGETIYSINWLPFGGFVKLTGEDFGDDGPEALTEDGDPLLDKYGNKIEGGKDPRNFKNKSPLQRGMILGAGVFMNIILAIALYYSMFFITGFKTMTIPLFFEHEFAFGNKEVVHTTVTAFVSPESPGKDAGIEIGEAIIEVDNQPVYSAKDVRDVLKQKNGEEVSVLLMDVRAVERTFRTIHLKPTVTEEGDFLIGVLLTEAFRLDYGNSKGLSGLMHTWNMFSYSTSTLRQLFSAAIKEKDVTYISDSVSGPVGITRAVSGILAYEEGNVLVGLIDLTALLSVSLAFLNILPFPALDGGRLLFVIIEAIRGRRMSDKFEGTLHKWGMVFLLGLIVLITAKDIISLI